ncbi:MAG: fasciclin domain-containing protein [Bacteroidales bacterium]|nr:fasciclin domain-containing protein [Bacteroidales bacterium]MCF8389347.1 fasciclin domain-containing protein [Bacteroidales bacterium]
MNPSLKTYNRKQSIKRIFSSLFQVLGIILFLSTTACDKDFDKHFTPVDKTIEGNIWDGLLQNGDYSTFVEYIETFGLDSIIINGENTLFIPNNQAFANLADSIEITERVIKHLISPAVFSFRNVQNYSKLLTLAGKYAFIEKKDLVEYFDEVVIFYSSKLFINGRYYETNEVPLAKQSIEEYIENNLSGLYQFINMLEYDSLDKANSTPIDFDEKGNTIYDSVFIKVDVFNNSYFPVDEESRSNFATFVLFSKQQYFDALDEMAANLGGSIQSHEDIPLSWLQSVLYPDIINNGCFKGMLNPENFNETPLLNINGEKVTIDVNNIDYLNPIICSNGIIYNYLQYGVASSLYTGDLITQGESLVDSLGVESYTWKEDIVVSNVSFLPLKKISTQASENAYLSVSFGNNYTGEYSMEYTVSNVFPRRYRMVWRANYRPSGLYGIYINNEKITEFDTFTLRDTRLSKIGERWEVSTEGFNSVDFWIENITEYGDVKIRFEYLGKGKGRENGLSIDYVTLIPSPL